MTIDELATQIVKLKQDLHDAQHDLDALMLSIRQKEARLNKVLKAVEVPNTAPETWRTVAIDSIQNVLKAVHPNSAIAQELKWPS